MSFWTEVVRPLAKVAVAAVAAYFGYWQVAAVMLQAGVSDYQEQKAKRQARDAYNAAQRDRMQMVSSATNPRQDVYGNVVVSGTVLLKHSAGAKKEFLYVAVELARHEIDAIESVWIGDQEIPMSLVDATGAVTSGPFNKGTRHTESVSRNGLGTITVPHGIARIVSAVQYRTTGSTGDVDVTAQVTYSGQTITIGGNLAPTTDRFVVTWEWVEGEPLVHVYTALGSPTQTAFAAWQTEIPTKWTAAHRLQGRAAVGLKLKYDVDVFGQLRDVNIKCKVRGKKVWDPRTGQTAYSRNSALIQADYLKTAMRATAAQVPDAELAAEATICDQLVPIGPGNLFTQPRYTCDLAISTAIPPKEGRDMITETMAGSVVWVQGRWLIRAGAWHTPDITLTAADLATGSISIAPNVSRRQLCNQVIATYAEPAKNWVMVPAPAVKNATYLAADGGMELQRQIVLEGVTDQIRAQRLARIDLERTRAGGMFVARWSANAYDCTPGGIVNVQIARYFGGLTKPFEVLERKLDLSTMEIELTLRETTSAIYDWNGGMPFTFDLTPNTDQPNPLARPASLTGLAAASGNATLMMLSDGTIISRVRVTWTQHPDVFVTRGGSVEIEWRPVDATAWIPTANSTGDSTEAMIGPVDDQAAIVLRARVANASGRASDWVSVGHIVAGKTAPPSNVTGLVVAVVPSGIRISWTACPDLDYDQTEIRLGATWATAQRQWIGSADTYIWPMPLLGSYTAWVVHRDTSGNESTPVSIGVTVDQATVNAWQSALPSGANLVFNADFQVGEVGWEAVSSNLATNITTGINGAPPASWQLNSGIGPSTNALFIRQVGYVAGTNVYSERKSTPIPIKPSTRYIVSGYTGAHRCKVSVFAYWYDAAGAYINNSHNGTTTDNDEEKSGGTTIASWKRVYSIIDTPTNAATMVLVVRKWGTKLATSADSWGFYGRVQTEEAGATASAPGAWSPGLLGYSGDLNATYGATFGENINGQASTIDIKPGATCDVITVKNQLQQDHLSTSAWVTIAQIVYPSPENCRAVFSFSFDASDDAEFDATDFVGPIQYTPYNTQYRLSCVSASGTTYGQIRKIVGERSQYTAVDDFIFVMGSTYTTKIELFVNANPGNITKIFESLFKLEAIKV